MAMNVGLDLEASAMPLTPDPAVRGRRKPAVDFNARVQAIARQLVASGMDPTEANQVAVSRAVQEGQASITPEDVAAERQEALSSGVELGINDPAVLGMEEETGPYQGAGRPGYDRTFTPDEIAAQRAEQEATMQAQREQWAEQRNAAIGAKYGPGARQIAEAGDADGVTDYRATRTPAEQRRIDERRGYEWDARNGNVAARDNLVAQDQAGADKRKAFRAAVANAPKPAVDPRMERYKAQMMLAGSNPRKNMVNAWSMMDDPGVSEQQRRSLQYMLPGGQLAATVDANNAAMAGRMAQQAMTAFLTNNPAATPEQRAALEQRAREANPAAAGASDVAAGKPETPEAQAELDRLAESMDTSLGGFSYDDEARLANALQRPPYSMSQAEAEATAYRYAEKRRWFWNRGGGPGGNRPNGAPPASPPPGYPGGAAAPPPANPMAAPRPFG